MGLDCISPCPSTQFSFVIGTEAHIELSSNNRIYGVTLFEKREFNQKYFIGPLRHNPALRQIQVITFASVMLPFARGL